MFTSEILKMTFTFAKMTEERITGQRAASLGKFPTNGYNWTEEGEFNEDSQIRQFDFFRPQWHDENACSRAVTELLDRARVRLINFTKLSLEEQKSAFLLYPPYLNMGEFLTPPKGYWSCRISFDFLKVDFFKDFNVEEEICDVLTHWANMSPTKIDDYNDTLTVGIGESANLFLSSSTGENYDKQDLWLFISDNMVEALTEAMKKYVE